jgi:hypothetical protein
MNTDFARWLLLPLLVTGLALLVVFIKNLVGLGKKNTLFSIGLKEDQPIEFAEAGRVLLCVEGPMFTRHFVKLRYQLIDANNTEVQGRTSLLRTSSSGFTRARMEIMSFSIPNPGRYSLRIQGLQEQEPEDSPYRIVFMRPYFGKVIVNIFGVLFASAVFIVSLVFFLLFSL